MVGEFDLGPKLEIATSPCPTSDRKHYPTLSETRIQAISSCNTVSVADMVYIYKCELSWGVGADLVADFGPSDSNWSGRGETHSSTSSYCDLSHHM